MGDHYKMLFQDTLSAATGAELLYTVPTNYSAIVKDAEAVNISVNPAIVTIWLVPPGEAVDDRWLWRPPTEVDPGGEIIFEGSKTLQAAYEIWAEASDDINLLIGGMEVDETPS